MAGVSPLDLKAEAAPQCKRREEGMQEAITWGTGRPSAFRLDTSASASSRGFCLLQTEQKYGQGALEGGDTSDCGGGGGGSFAYLSSAAAASSGESACAAECSSPRTAASVQELLPGSIMQASLASPRAAVAAARADALMLPLSAGEGGHVGGSSPFYGQDSLPVTPPGNSRMVGMPSWSEDGGGRRSLGSGSQTSPPLGGGLLSLDTSTSASALTTPPASLFPVSPSSSATTAAPSSAAGTPTASAAAASAAAASAAAAVSSLGAKKKVAPAELGSVISAEGLGRSPRGNVRVCHSTAHNAWLVLCCAGGAESRAFSIQQLGNEGAKRVALLYAAQCRRLLSNRRAAAVKAATASSAVSLGPHDKASKVKGIEACASGLLEADFGSSGPAGGAYNLAKCAGNASYTTRSVGLM
ncbi:mucin-19 [Cyclospora cayetanensis]|uniref:Mucin-19 n=1 Tax=Cyclospora cayetanensis TaxID=88456 RepID=A0A6P6S1B4_9EIME|nr:mucin-19 [Cyclospora cayetanensis]